MNEEVIADFKQFMVATISQHLGEFQTDFYQKLTDELKLVEHRLTDQITGLSQSIADALEAVNESNDARLNSHEQRLVHLETKAS